MERKIEKKLIKNLIEILWFNWYTIDIQLIDIQLNHNILIKFLIDFLIF